MDPNEALRQIREAVSTWRAGAEYGWRSEEDSDRCALRLVKHAEALDEWLSRGGFLPAAWQAGRPESAQVAAARRALDRRSSVDARLSDAQMLAGMRESADTIQAAAEREYLAERELPRRFSSDGLAVSDGAWDGAL